MISLTIVFIILAAIFNASMDVLRTRYSDSIFSKWKNQNWVNPALSWPNKWKPKSKFGDFLMSTILVWVTDFWHLCKFLMILFIIAAIIVSPVFIINWWADFLILYGLFGITFEIFYSKILILKS